MERRAWAGIAAAVVGTIAGLIAMAGGQLLPGALAALCCAACGAGIVVNTRRAAVEIIAARDEAMVRQAEARAREAAEEREAALEQRLAAELALQEQRDGSVLDPETGLLDHRIFAVTFERKVAAARRHLRPLSLILLDIGSRLPAAEADRKRLLRGWGAVIEETLRESDVPCRVGDTTFGIILEDTPEAGGVWVAERLQIAAACRSSALSDLFSAAVASYPNHGLTSTEVLDQAWAALDRARGRTIDQARFGRVELPSPEQ